MGYGRLAHSLAPLAGMAAMMLPACVLPTRVWAAERSFAIPPQNLANALSAFRAQSGATIFYQRDAVRAAQTAGVAGRFEPEAALQRLLTGTGFEFSRVDDGLAVVPGARPAGRSPRPASDVPVRGVERQDPLDAYAEVALDEVVVTGSRIVQRGLDLPTPVTVIGADRIAQSGANQLSAVTNDLPQFRANESSTTVFVSGGIGGSQLNLRGLGSVRTLVLVDGLRFPATGNNGTFNTDLIPSSLVSRLDIVTGGASAAYGSDAVAGVVNIILDHRIKGFRGSVQTGVSDHGDGQEQKYSIAGGHGVLDDRLYLIGGAEYDRRRSVGGCYSRAWCAREYATISNPTPGVNGLPAILIAPNVHTSQLTAAGLVVSSQLKAAYGGQQISRTGAACCPSPSASSTPPTTTS